MSEKKPEGYIVGPVGGMIISVALAFLMHYLFKAAWPLAQSVGLVLYMIEVAADRIIRAMLLVKR